MSASLLQGVIRWLRRRRDREDAEIAAAAEAAVAHFGGDLGKARLWAVDEAIRFDRLGDRRRNLIAVRIDRAIKAMTKAACAPSGR